MIRLILSFPAICLCLLLSATSHGQTKSTADGVYSKAQAEAGGLSYQASCGGCHDVKFYRDIWPYWQGKRLIDFYWRIVAEMPSDNPGSLSDDEYTKIVAYILSELDYPIGESSLNPLNDMDNITISAQ
ncbi:MAG: c-type cytochrome [Pseudohongiellaceae bacterium]